MRIYISIRINTSTDVDIGISSICFSSSCGIHVNMRIRNIANICSLLMLHFREEGHY